MEFSMENNSMFDGCNLYGGRGDEDWKVPSNMLMWHGWKTEEEKHINLQWIYDDHFKWENDGDKIKF